MYIVRLYNYGVSGMAVVIDTSVLIAVVAGESERTALIEATEGEELIAPASVHWEIGNACSAMLKLRRASWTDVESILAAYARIPIRFLDVDLVASLALADRLNLYAYDAYLLACAQTRRAPLLTLDRTLRIAALRAGVGLMEVPE